MDSRIYPDQEEGKILTVGFSASGAGGAGANYFLGMNYNMSNGYGNYFASWGMSAGYGGTFGITALYRWNSTLQDANVYGNKVRPSKNSYEANLQYAQVVINPSKKGLDVKGVGLSISKRQYYGLDFTTQSTWTKPYFMLKNIMRSLIF